MVNCRKMMLNESCLQRYFANSQKDEHRRIIMRRHLGLTFACLAASAAIVIGLFSPAAAQTETHHVAFVPPAFTSPFHVAMADGAREEATAKGWRIDVQAPASEDDFAGQLTIVQQLLETGVEAISVNPINVD